MAVIVHQLNILHELPVNDCPFDRTLQLMGNARETWAGSEDAQIARQKIFEILRIANPDEDGLDFYLRLDPLTWELQR